MSSNQVLIEAILRERRTVKDLAQMSKNQGSVPDATIGPAKSLSARVTELLEKLEKVTMTVDIKRDTQIDQYLKLIYGNEAFHFSEPHRLAAKALYERWEAENWGFVKEEENDDVEMADAALAPVSPRSIARRASRVADADQIFYPPVDHPLFGIDKIMHGVAIKANNNYVLDDRYKKRSGKVFGHNGNTVGTWYPRRLLAIFYGAHEASMAGVVGDIAHGAYSVVVAGLYDDVDHDRGNTIEYSGPRSHENDDPRNVITNNATSSLMKSIETGRPVRVLRGYTGKSRYAPEKGLRYDGLYTIVSYRVRKNGLGGVYEQFLMQRREGQPDLEEIARTRPSQQELRAYRPAEDVKRVSVAGWKSAIKPGK